MAIFIGLLRAVNLGGDTVLPMAALRSLCADCGFRDARTYIASGNVLFDADGDEGRVKAALESALRTFGGRDVPVMVRTAAEMDAVLTANPFPDNPPNRMLAIFLDEPATPAMLDGVRHQTVGRIALGAREIYVAYGEGMGRSKLAMPAAPPGTGRNMNTVAKLAHMARS